MQRSIILFSILFLSLVACQESKPTETNNKIVSEDSNKVTVVLQDTTPIQQDSTSVQPVTYVQHHPCSFSIELPSHFGLRNINRDSSPDFCDYGLDVGPKDSFCILEVHALNASRFSNNPIDDAYKKAIQNPKFNLTHNSYSAGTSFLIKGTLTENGHYLCWKRILDDNFVNDLLIEYSKEQEAKIAPYLTKIIESFTSK
ncbi:MAG: hypothetical protein GY810_31900 [Aureispira sp.]|nr:hypothetical protein [Aureispira sp.]